MFKSSENLSISCSWQNVCLFLFSCLYVPKLFENKLQNIDLQLLYFVKSFSFADHFLAFWNLTRSNVKLCILVHSNLPFHLYSFSIVFLSVVRFCLQYCLDFNYLSLLCRLIGKVVTTLLPFISVRTTLANLQSASFHRVFSTQMSILQGQSASQFLMRIV